MFPIVEPDQSAGRSTEPALSPGKPTLVTLPNPKRRIHEYSRSLPSFSASVIAPTFDDCARMRATLIVSVPRFSASLIVRSATLIEYGSTNDVCGETSLSESAPATVTSLNVEPGS